MTGRLFLAALAAGTAALAEPYSIEALRPWSVNSTGGSQVSIPASLSHPGATLWTSFPAETSPAEKQGDQLVFRIRPHVTNGIGVIRVVGTNAISLPKLIAIDSFPTVSAGSTNTAQDRALTLAPPCAVELAVEGTGSRWFSVDLPKGTWLGLDVLAHRFGSPLDPFLRVLDPAGHEIEVADDTAGLGTDAELRFQSRIAGPHPIELRDSSFSGGKDERCRLRIGDFTAARSIPIFPAYLLPPTDASAMITDISERAEPAVSVALPAMVRGVLRRPGSSYVLRLEGIKDRWLRVAAASRSIGSPGDVAVALESSDGRLLAELDATRADDGSFSHKFPETGSYRLVVRELNRAGGPDYVFQLALRSGRGEADLQAERHSIDSPPDSTVEIKVAINRKNFELPLTFRAAGLPADFASEPVTVDAKGKDAVVKVRVPQSAKPGTLVHFGIVAETEIDSVKSVERVQTRTALRKTWPEVLFPPPGMDGVIALGIRGK